MFSDDDSQSDAEDELDDRDNEDNVDSPEKENNKPQEKFSANPLYRAAFAAMSSRYNKLIDTGDDDEDNENKGKAKQSKNADKEEKAANKYNKLVDQTAEDKSKPSKHKLSNQSLNNKKTDNDTDSKNKADDDDILNYRKPLPKNTHIAPSGAIIRPRKRHESSSSHADEDALGEQKGTEFHYRELDDEYGSRPSAHTTKKDHDVISMISTSSQEYDPAPKHVPIPAPRRSISEAETECTPPEKPDPIIGHEHGVRPLLDDDELENVYGPAQAASAPKVAESASETETIYQSPQSSVPTSPVPKPETTDVFGAAPFKKKTLRKKRPSSSLQSTTPDMKSEPQKLSVKTKPTVPPKPSKMSSSQGPSFVNKHRNKRHASGGEMSVGLLQRSDDSDNDEAMFNDVFGNAPFMKRSSSSTDAVLHSVSPNLGKNDQRNGIANSLSADSLSKAPDLVQESFSTLPFTATISTTTNNTSVKNGQRPPISVTQNQQVSGSFRSQVTIPILPSKPKTFPNTVDISTGPSVKPLSSVINSKQTSQGIRETRAPSPSYSKFKDELDSDDDDFGHNDKKAYLKVKPSRSPRPAERDFESSAFSNMSFNDDFDDEVDETRPPGISSSMNEANLQTLKSSHSQELSVSRNQQQGFMKEPSPVNQDSAKPGYDTFTWPRKGHKVSLKSHATAEPFTVKKKLDIFK